MTSNPSMIVASQYVDLRREPIPQKGEIAYDPLQETQLLYGEEVRIHYQRGGWVYVEAMDQPRFQGQWGGYGGWIPEGHLKEGLPPNATVTALRAILYPEPNSSLFPCRRVFIGMRLHIGEKLGEFVEVYLPDQKVYIRQAALTPLDPVEVSRAWLESPYRWGKLMPPGSGTDCSGLVHLAYRTQGLFLPRNSNDQYKACTLCQAEELKRGDLLFMGKKEDPKAISHVMIYEGEEQLIESTATVNKVQSITANQKFKFSLSELSSNIKYDEFFLFFGKPQ